MANFWQLEQDGSNLSAFHQRMIIDRLCSLMAVADTLEQDGDTARAVEDIRALVGNHSAGLWQAVGKLHSLTDELLERVDTQD